MRGALDPVHEARQRANSDDLAPERRTDGFDGPDAGGNHADGGTLASELREAIRDAAVAVLKPVARQATRSAAQYAVAKAPSVVEEVAPKAIGAGGATVVAMGVIAKRGRAAGGVGHLAGGIAKQVVKAKIHGRGGLAGGIAEKVTGKGKGGKKPTGYGRGRRLPVYEHIDVAVDLQTAYGQYTQFEDWPQFMHRVEKVEQRDDNTVMLHENIWGVRRSWEAEIVEQKPCERIVWRSKGPLQTVGVASFHRLSDNLTRVQVNMDFQPQWLFEKTASGMRLSRRALRSDLMRFRASVEMRDDATGGWLGRIEEGEVTETPEPHKEQRDGERDDEAPGASARQDVRHNAAPATRRRPRARATSYVTAR